MRLCVLCNFYSVVLYREPYLKFSFPRMGRTPTDTQDRLGWLALPEVRLFRACLEMPQPEAFLTVNLWKWRFLPSFHTVPTSRRRVGQ